MATDKPYKIKDEHEDVIKISPQEADLDANEYHKVPGGVIVPQSTEFGGVVFEGDHQEIPVVEVSMAASDGDGETRSKTVAVHQRNKPLQEVPPENVAPSGLVAPVSQPAVPPPKPTEQIVLKSDLFGTIKLPVNDVIHGEGCIILVTAEQFSFVPPVSDKPFTMIRKNKEEQVWFVGQQFERKALKEQYLILVPPEKE